MSEINSSCDICNEINSNENNFFTKSLLKYYKKYDLETRIIYKNKNFFVMPSVGPISPCHLLVCPIKHVNSFAQLDYNILEEATEFLINILKLVHDEYGCVIAFEHGSSKEGISSSSCSHAHIHVLAAKIPLEEKLKQKGLYLEKIESIKEIKSIFKNNTPYFLIIDNKGVLWVTEDEICRSQYLRILCAEELGIKDGLWQNNIGVKQMISNLNGRISGDKNYEFGLKLGSNSMFENELMIFENDIGIDSKGAGTQVFIKTDFALDRAGDNIDVILLEEPENHLSHTNLRKLIQKVSESQEGQMFITTHNSLISTRLELNNLLIMHTENSNNPLTLKSLSANTSKYFMKAPVTNIIEFIISKKAILVEGPSEYILFEKFYENVMQHKPEQDGVHIMDIRGLSFKRYLEVAKHLNSKVAVITDNDGDGHKNCVEKYTDFSNEQNIKIFYDLDNAKNTFEKVLFYKNEELCIELFNDNALNFMLKNKTEAAFTLLEKDANINVPEYIRGAITWISE